MSKGIRCCSCGKKLAEKISIQIGFVEITCKCGTLNRIEANTPVNGNIPGRPAGEDFTRMISRSLEKKIV
jgi:phage FluMu protein Com